MGRAAEEVILTGRDLTVRARDLGIVNRVSRDPEPSTARSTSTPRRISPRAPPLRCAIARRRCGRKAPRGRQRPGRRRGLRIDGSWRFDGSEGIRPSWKSARRNGRTRDSLRRPGTGERRPGAGSTAPPWRLWRPDGHVVRRRRSRRKHCAAWNNGGDRLRPATRRPASPPSSGSSGDPPGGLTGVGPFRRDPPGTGATWKLTPEDWGAVMAVNLDAAFHLTRAAIPIMRENGGGVLRCTSVRSTERGKVRAERLRRLKGRAPRVGQDRGPRGGTLRDPGSA